MNNADTTQVGEAAYGSSCTEDYIVIAEAGATANTNANFHRFCGEILGIGAAGAFPNAASTIITRMIPYQVGVYTDGFEQEKEDGANTFIAEPSKGFNLYYSQTAC